MRGFVCAAACGLLLAGAGCRREAPAEQAARAEQTVAVVARAAEVGSLRTIVRASGTVVPAAGAEFLATAPEPARVVEVGKEAGAAVASGDLLVRFELPSAIRDVARLGADLASTEAELERARVAQARAREFAERGLIPRIERDAADRAFADAQAAVERARTVESAAAAAADKAIVRAPFDGIVAARLHNPGDLVQGAGTDPVLRVVDPRRLEIGAFVAAADAARVLPGATARTISPTDGRIIRLMVTPHAAAPRPAADGTVPVRLEFAEPITDLPVDTRVEVDIDADERTNVVFVAPEAVLMENGQAFVFVANADRAERRTITTGLADEQRIEVTSGLAAGDLVITQGHIGLTNGERITAAISR
jgi:RND family efflux transporter MFP subunit